MKKHWLWLFLIVLAVVVLLPPILHGADLKILNNDTAAHLAAFESIKNGNPHFLYFGQKVVGYSLVGIESVTGIDLASLFMWFNFLAFLLCGVAVGALVSVITKSKFGGALSALLILFGIGSTQHLFWSGTVFNLIEFLILLPLLLLVFYILVKKKTSMIIAAPVLLVIGIVMFFFHPSFIGGIKYLFSDFGIHIESVINPIVALLTFFGITNLILFAPCWLGVKSKEEKTEVTTKIVFGVVLSLATIMLLLAVFALTPFSSRMIINAFLLLGIVLCIYIGEAMKSESRIVKGSIVGLVAVAILPNLINWFTWTSFYNPMRGAY